MFRRGPFEWVAALAEMGERRENFTLWWSYMGSLSAVDESLLRKRDEWWVDERVAMRFGSGGKGSTPTRPSLGESRFATY